jgi:ABC-type uncharacterized transport system substrate-binding protein
MTTSRATPLGIGLAMLPVALCVFATPAAAHPHVWMTVTVAPTFDASGRLASVHEKWFFDYDYSLLVGSQLDANGDGQFSVEELIMTISSGGLLGWIAEKNYLTLFTVGGKQVPNGAVTGISVGVVDARLTVEFNVALPEPQLVKLGAEVDIFDPEVYYDVQFDKPDVTPVAAPASCSVVPRPKDELDPFAVMVIKRLGLPADPKIMNDPAVGFTVRVAITCS